MPDHGDTLQRCSRPQCPSIRGNGLPFSTVPAGMRVRLGERSKSC